jgi:indole-3-glycerol phosphate synthase
MQASPQFEPRRTTPSPCSQCLRHAEEKISTRTQSSPLKSLKTNETNRAKLASSPRPEPNPTPDLATPLRYHKCLPPAAPDILARIVARKREELREATVPLTDLRRLAETRTDHRDFATALRSKHPAVISEIKKASPSKGVLVEDFRPADLALKYQQGGAVALSVLTDKDFFQGSLADLRSARAATTLPVIRKDFTISEYHVYEAAAAGADAILLIVAILDEAELRAFRELAKTCGMAALVEAHNASEVDTAVRSGAEIIGINNRDLRTFKVSLDTSVDLAPSIPPGITKVSESGIFNPDDIRRLTTAGFDAFLVGEHLVKSGDATRALQELVA